MKLTGIEKASLVLAIFLVAGGIVLATHPVALHVMHASHGAFPGTSMEGGDDYVTKPMGRICGFLGVAFGAGIVFVVFYGKQE